ncbi:Exo_endo_phos domain-containing protein [Cephalotus follicularis]|uniref:Exo_endo_phos domain-containing protein n=1 Tax=Cephalotus follicularis TaxID=3775 RepID=A0A1Q3AS09_CEPFO|nr:Exo_endo_phos domain-containing protein [Cephalotus follicularis]
MIKGACWNIRGLNDPIKQREVKSLILNNNITFMGLLETRVRARNKDRVAQGLPRGWKSFTNHVHSLLGRIWVLWNPISVQFTVIDISPRAIHGSLIIGKSVLYVSIVYGSCDFREMRNLWENLIHHSSCFSGRPWVILGDFNVSRYPREHSGDRPLLSKAMVEFDQCIRKCEVEDLRQTGHLFSWSNKRTWDGAVAKKIDRAIGNWLWFKECSDFQAHFPPPGSKAFQVPQCLGFSSIVLECGGGGLV